MFKTLNLKFMKFPDLYKCQLLTVIQTYEKVIMSVSCVCGLFGHFGAMGFGCNFQTYHHNIINWL